jgi:hypothetical protein
MSGRRAYYRYGVANAGGSLRVLRDVVVRKGTANELVVIADEAAAVGELLTLERIVDGGPTAIEVMVVDSRPAIVNGTMRHRVRLSPIKSAAAFGGRRTRRGH